MHQTLQHPYLEQPFAIRWSQLSPSAIEPDITLALEKAQQRIDAIANIDPNLADFENTFLALDEATIELDTAWGLIAHLDSVMNNPEHRAAYNKMLPQVSDFAARIPLNQQLWKTLRYVAEQPQTKALDGTWGRLRDETLANFREAGADLPVAKQERLAAVEQELAQKTQKFSENALDAINAFELVITDADRLRGLPQSALDAAVESARKKGIGSAENPAWRFTLHAPSLIPVLEYAEDATLRSSLYQAFFSVGREPPYDNGPLIQEILNLRAEKAALLEKQHFAETILPRRMVMSADRALDFIHDLHDRAVESFNREIEELERFKAESLRSPLEPLEPWDFLFWAERLRRERYDFDAEELRPYFPIKSVIDGMFRICERLFGIEIHRVDTDCPETWHPEVTFFEVRDRHGRHLGSFYSDWHPRESKRGGAWMNFLRTGGPRSDGSFSPHLGLINGNLTPPLGEKPALLTHDEVLTVFHEFGHLLHHLLSEVDVRSLSGVQVAWDFVELPSQILENWAWERDGLDNFARHFETGERIPDTLFDKMIAARRFGASYRMMRQLMFAKLDMELHTRNDPFAMQTMDDVIDEIVQGYRPRMKTQWPVSICNFGHLFSSATGYAAGYYSYKWAEVLAADAFTRFKEKGILDESVGRSFRECILSRGNAEDPAELYRRFMGRDPDIAPLLRQEGLLADSVN